MLKMQTAKVQQRFMTLSAMDQNQRMHVETYIPRRTYMPPTRSDPDLRGAQPLQR